MAPKKYPKGYSVHAHGCTGCRERYEDSCLYPNNNGECLNCETGRPSRMPLLILSRMPHTCCFLASRLARKDEVEKRNLSRACQWFICETCRRTFPYLNPSKVPVDERFPACCLYAVKEVDDIIRHRLRLTPDVTYVCVLCGTPATQQ